MVVNTVAYQHKQNANILEQYGTNFSSKRTRHVNINYFFITLSAKKDKKTMKYCPTSDMMADNFTKLLQGDLFCKFRPVIMSDVADGELSWEQDYLDTPPNSHKCVGGEESLLAQMTDN